MKNNFFITSAFVLSLAMILPTDSVNAQNIGINATGAAPDGGAMLDVSATNKGVLLPRVNIANLSTIAPVTGSSTVGMLVYNTNTTTGVGYYYWDGSNWVRFSTGGGAWELTGNAGTNANTNFLGTTDNTALRIRTNNTNRFEFSTNGAIRSFGTGSAGVPSYSWTANTNMGMYRATANSIGFSTAGIERMRIGDYAGSIGFGKTPCCGSLGGPIVDSYLPMEVGNDGGQGLQARIGYWYGSDVAIEPETNMYGYVGYSGVAWWRMYSYGYVNASERSKKKEITPINENKDIESLIFKDIEKIAPSFYYYNEQNSNPSSKYDTKYRPHFQLGVIVDESPDYLLDESFKGVDIYALASLSIAGVKYNHKRIQVLEENIEKNTIIKDFGSVLVHGNEVLVSYDIEFLSQLNGVTPVINLTAVSRDAQNLRIVEKTDSGFIVINESDTEAISFDWIAVAKVNNETESPQSVTQNLDDELVNKIHLTPEVKQKVIKHYSGIVNTLSRQTE